MRISPDAYKLLLEGCPPAPPESGGILGGKGGMITLVALDEGECPSDGTYTPNVALLNEQIGSWGARDIEFCGMFHTHAPWDEGLSKGDRAYIRSVMSAMPKGVEELYFPVVYPGERVLSYVARRKDSDISISEDLIQFAYATRGGVS